MAAVAVITVAHCIGLPSSFAQLDIASLTTLQMSSIGGGFQHIRIPSTGQLLTRIGTTAWQGNADIYPVDPRITTAGDVRRAGHYWSQFLMNGVDPATGQYFLTDRVESEGQTLQSFNVIQSTGKVIEYEGTWSFRNLFTTTAHHWVWVEGSDHYHRTQVSLEVLNPIPIAYSVWTELFNATDGYGRVTAKTRDDGIQTRSSLGTSNQHHLGQYELGRDDWIAFSEPQDDQAGSVARVLLSSESDIRSDDEVTPIWADFTLFDNIELHVHRTSGTNLAAGTTFFMDNLLITNPTTNSTEWVDDKVSRGKEWIEIIGPPIADPVIDPGNPQSRFFAPSGGTGSWDLPGNWSPSPVPDANDAAFIHAGRTAIVSSDVGSVGTVTVGDSGTGQLNLQTGAALNVTNRVLIGAGAGNNQGFVQQTGGQLTVGGGDPVVFLAFDEGDSAQYTISAGKLSTGNLWFRFGMGTMTQTGGLVEVTQLVLGEGGSAASQAMYDIQSGALKIAGPANIGKAPGLGDPIANSHGIMNISGGVVMAGDLLFGNDATDQVIVSDSGVLRVQQSNYSVAEAMNHITSGRLIGSDLHVTTISIAGTSYTQITAFDPVPGDFDIDGDVDGRDFLIWQRTLGSVDDLRADADGSLVVDQPDLAIWMDNYSSVSPITATVPEPASSIVLLLIALEFIFRRP